LIKWRIRKNVVRDTIIIPISYSCLRYVYSLIKASKGYTTVLTIYCAAGLTVGNFVFLYAYNEDGICEVVNHEYLHRILTDLIGQESSNALDNLNLEVN